MKASSHSPRITLQIISGGQTGADRAALDWAIAHHLPQGGWCPHGRLAEDGTIPRRYELKETPLPDYAQRTEWNVRDADATVIFSIAATLAGGSLFTLELARSHHKPCLHLARSVHAGNAAKQLHAFLVQHHVRVLNVAGPRASQEPEVGVFVQETLEQAWRLG